METDRLSSKRDRLARFYRVLRVLESRGEAGARPDEIARQVGMSPRTVYRDLKALESELGIPVWNDEGRWGVDGRAFLPPLRLTRAEAMAVFLSARLMARYADKYDPDLGAAFQKLSPGLPPVLREHVERTVELMADRPLDDRFRRNVHLLTVAWAERRVISLTYDPATYDPGRPPRQALVHPYLMEPSLTTHALYLIGFDETRQALRTFKIERILELALTNETFTPPEGAIEDALGRAWDIIADQTEVEVVVRFSPTVAGRVRETTWHPSQRIEAASDGSLLWRARIAGTIEIKVWILSWGADAEVLEPAELRREVAEALGKAASQYA